MITKQIKLMNKLKFLSWFALTVFSATVWAADMEGPWAYVGRRTGTCDQNQNNSISYNGLNNSHWEGDIQYMHQSDYGTGSIVIGKSTDNSKHAVFSLFSMTKTIPSYARCQLTWNYQLKAQNNKHYSRTSVYEATNQATLQSAALDFTLDMTSGAGSSYLIFSFPYKSFENIKTSATQTRQYDFNNLSGTSDKNEARYLIMTHVMTADEKMSGVTQFGTLKSVSAQETWTYRVIFTFNNNGGTGTMSNQTIDNSGNLTANAFTRAGYSFKNWTANQDGSGKTYGDKGAVSATSDYKGPKTLYAQWTANKYTVTFDKQGGSGGSANVTATYNETMPNSASMPSRANYQFLGYYDAAEGGKQYYKADGTPACKWDKAADATLYAHWMAIYKITYDLAGGEIITVPFNPSTYTVETETFTLTNPWRTAYTFIGWTGSNGDIPQTVVNIVKGSTGDKNFTANWAINPKTVVVYKDSLDNTVAQETAAFNRPEAPEVPGFTFLRWDVVEGPLKAGIKLQAVYAAKQPSNAPKQTVGKFTLVRQGDTNEYILQTAK